MRFFKQWPFERGGCVDKLERATQAKSSMREASVLLWEWCCETVPQNVLFHGKGENSIGVDQVNQVHQDP